MKRCQYLIISRLISQKDILFPNYFQEERYFKVMLCSGPLHLICRLGNVITTGPKATSIGLWTSAATSCEWWLLEALSSSLHTAFFLSKKKNGHCFSVLVYLNHHKALNY